MTDRLRIKGADQIASGLDRLSDRLDNLRAAETEAASLAVNRLRAAAPIRTGALAASIQPGLAVGDARVSVTIRYAPPVISGVPARRMRGNRFVERTAEAIAPQVQQIYERATQAACDDIKGA